MSLHRFFLENQVLSSIEDGVFEARLSKEDVRHLRAARICSGELVAVVDSDSDYFCCEVLQVSENGFTARVASSSCGNTYPFRIHLFQGIPKGSKMDDVVRHATEVGAFEFHLLESARCVSRPNEKQASNKVERLSRIAKSAAEQSGRVSVPSVCMPISMKEAACALQSFDCAVIFWEEASQTCTLSQALQPAKSVISNGEVPNIALFVGPEGGFSEEEVNLLLDSSETASLSTLGPNILRTETAGVIGCALTSYELGGMGARTEDRDDDVRDGEGAFSI